jgi:metallophosphoesterase (TIGR00282 family)
MRPLDCPFRAVESAIEALAAETKVTVVDFHAEATSEKLAMGWFLDGRASAVIGTHTHVQTADERVLPGGTAYITDVGMTGPSESVIGVKKDIIVRRFLTALPERFETAKGYPQLQAVLCDIDPTSGKASSISRLSLTDS